MAANLNVQSIAFVLVRFFALLLLLNCISPAEQLLILIDPAANFGQPVTSISLTIVIAKLIILLSLGLFFFVRSSSFINLLFVPPDIHSDEKPITHNEFATIVFAALGIYIIINGFEVIFFQIAMYYFAPQDTFGNRPDMNFQPAKLTISIINVIFGLLLVFSSNGLLKLIKYARGIDDK